MTDAAVPSGNFELAESDLGDYHVAIPGAEVLEDYDGEPAIRVSMDYTNNGSEDASCWWACTVYVYQDDVELFTTIPDESTDSDAMFGEELAPGETASCSECYTLLNTTDPVEIVVSDYGDNPIGIFCELG